MSNLEDEQLFWDDFAEEYYAIQQESFTTIVEDVTAYLKEISVLPCDTLADIAGGYGKYMVHFLPLVDNYLLVDFSSEMLRLAKQQSLTKNVQYIQADQAVFCLNSQDNQYDIVYSAMNPALTTVEDIKELYRIAKKEVILLYVIQDEDTIFSPIETLYQSPKIRFEKAHAFKNWLTSQVIPWHVHSFSYDEETEVTREFVLDYFEEEASDHPDILEAIDRLFQRQSKRMNRHNIRFELIRMIKE